MSGETEMQSFGLCVPKSRRRIRLLFAFVLILFLSQSVRAQIDRAGLNGTITDPSGRVLPQTQVTADQNATGLQRKTTSSATGTYDIPELPVGKYTITFIHHGFKTLTYVDVEEVLGRTRTLDVTLQVSGNNERVEVSTSSEQIDRMSDALGGRIEQQQARELPTQRTQLGNAHSSRPWGCRYGRQ